MSRLKQSERVVCLIDCDCFYASVESLRFGLSADIPLAVRQWGSLIAVNYAARASGVSRMDHVDDAVAKCPSLRLVHVDTVDEHGVCHQSSVWTADASSQSSTQSQTTAEPAITSPVEQSAAASVAPSNIPVIASSTNAAKVRVPVHAARGNEKVSLERYRHTSQRILRVFASLVGEGCIERASVDEAYIDMTECVDKHIRQMLADPSTESSSLTWHGHVFGGEFQCSPLAEADIETKLCVCDRLVAELRRRVQTEIGVTCSAGISVNKIFAKFAAGMHKPNQQTIVPVRAISQLMQQTPLKKIRGMGGQLGFAMVSHGVELMSDLIIRFPSLGALQAVFDEKRAMFLWKLAHGIHDEEVRDRDVPLSMVVAKSFANVHSCTDSLLERMLNLLCNELSDRMVNYFEQYQRRPTVLHIHWNNAASKQMQLPAKQYQAVELFNIVMQFLKSGLPPSAYPLFNITLSVDKMTEIKQSGPGIKSFFGKAATGLQSSKPMVLSVIDDIPPAAKRPRVDTVSRIDSIFASSHESVPETKIAPNSTFVSKPEDNPDSGIRKFMPPVVPPTLCSTDTKQTITIDDSDDDIPVQSPAGQPSDWTCAECGVTGTGAASKQEHADYHVALRLSRSTAPPIVAQKPAVKSSKSTAKKPDEATLRQRIDSFFGSK